MALLLTFLSAPVFAGSIHKWVDAQGVTHYSDQLPEEKQLSNNQVTVTQVDVSDTYQTSVGPEDYYSVTNQWARMREERIARKQLQIEKAKQKATQVPAVPQIVYVNEEPETRKVYYPAYASFGHSSFRQNRFIGSRYRGEKHRSPRLKTRFGSRFGYRSSGLRYGGSGLTIKIR